MSELTDETVRVGLAEQAATIVAQYPEGRSRSALLPLLHLVQSVDGYVSPEGIAFCAEQLGLTKAEVGAVATFYTMYKRRPTGEYLVSICTNTMCGVLGGDKAYEAVSAYLEVGHDQTTDDGLITLEHAECLAACDYAPVMTVNYEYFDQVDADSALSLVKQLQDGEKPMPTRGARLCSFKETSRQLSGLADTRNGAVGDSSLGEPTVAGNRLAEERGVSVPGFYPNTPIGKKDAPAAAKAAPAAPAKAAPATAEAPAALIPAQPAEKTEAAPAASTAAAASGEKASSEKASAEPVASSEPKARAEAAGPVASDVPPGPGAVPAGEAAASQNTGQTASDDSTDPVTKPAEETEKPEKATRRRRGGPLASATAEPGGPRRPGNKAPAKRGGTRRPPNTERSAPAVEAADAVPAEPATEPSVTDTSTPTEPAETSETVPEPSVDSKPAGDASPTDPRNEQTEGEK